VSALYLTFYYIGATLGSFLPGLAWQSFGWMGVAACAWLALLVGLWAARMTRAGEKSLTRARPPAPRQQT
jgi:YNFM family putative membrane transporter